MYLKLIAAIVMGLGVTAAAKAEQGVSATEILIGEVEPLSGPPGLLGIAYAAGTKMAIAEANNAGGIDGKKLRLVVEDDGYVAARTIPAVKKLIEVDKVFALTSLSGSQGVAALPVVVKAGIPVMASIAPIEPLYQPVNKNVFVVGQSYEEGSYQLVRFLAKQNPGRKWAALTQDDDYGVALRAGFDKARKEGKLNVVFEGEYKKAQQDFSSEMLRLRSSGAEVFLAGGIIAENAAMVKELEKLNYKPVTGIFWPGRIPATLKLMGPASEGVYGIDYVAADKSEAVVAFTERAKSLLSEADFKAINRYTLVGYASTRVLIEAMRRCAGNLTWTCTISELEKTKNFETGVMGPISFGPGVRFSSQQLHVMRADFRTLSFESVK